MSIKTFGAYCEINEKLMSSENESLKMAGQTGSTGHYSSNPYKKSKNSSHMMDSSNSDDSENETFLNPLSLEYQKLLQMNLKSANGKTDLKAKGIKATQKKQEKVPLHKIVSEFENKIFE